jgi:hypothetical protein
MAIPQLNQGIIGLLNELHAYYLGSKFSYEMYPAYVEAAGDRFNGLLLWIRKSQSSMDALFEFSYYIFEYLLKMQRDYPQSYQLLLDNKGFKEAFGSIYDKYYALCMMYIRRIEQEAALINQEGKNDVKIVGDEIFFKSEGSSLLSIVPILKNARPILEKELQSDSLSNLPIFILAYIVPYTSSKYVM